MLYLRILPVDEVKGVVLGVVVRNLEEKSIQLKLLWPFVGNSLTTPIVVADSTRMQRP